MECLSNHKIAHYVEGSLSQVEMSMIRDHLLHCDRCRRLSECFIQLEENLSQPVLESPPTCIEKNVMHRLFPVLPSYSAVAALVLASFLLLVSWIYIYFDFAHNSLIQAMQMTSNRVFGFMGGIIQGISTIFSGIYAAFRAISKFLSVFLNLNIDGELVLLFVVMMTGLPVYFLYRFIHQHRRSRRTL